jgi:hypothetical protein
MLRTPACRSCNARVSLYGADNAEGILGIYLDGCVLDEVANFKPDVVA